MDWLVKNELIPALQKCEMVPSEPNPHYPNFSQEKTENIWQLASLRNYASLGAIANNYHYPIYAVPDVILKKKEE